MQAKDGKGYGGALGKALREVDCVFPFEGPLPRGA